MNLTGMCADNVSQPVHSDKGMTTALSMHNPHRWLIELAEEIRNKKCLLWINLVSGFDKLKYLRPHRTQMVKQPLDATVRNLTSEVLAAETCSSASE
jgi:hypothetical protein